MGISAKDTYEKDYCQRILEYIDPSMIPIHAGMIPDVWQEIVLKSTQSRILLLCGRQVGKSTVMSILAYYFAQFIPNQVIGIVSPSQKQSNETLRKVTDLEALLGYPVKKKYEAVQKIEYLNRSRILALPGNQKTARGLTGDLILLDEGAQILDEVYTAISPMLSIRKGRLVIASTAFGKIGWFFNKYETIVKARTDPKNPNKYEDWLVINITADDCPRHTSEFLDSERDSMGEKLFNQEYYNTFLDPVDSVFTSDVINRIWDDGIKPLIL
jgi:hypothetical protein